MTWMDIDKIFLFVPLVPLELEMKILVFGSKMLMLFDMLIQKMWSLLFRRQHLKYLAKI